MTYRQPAEESGLWGVGEAAAYLGCSVLTLRSWCSRRRVPFVRVGGRLVRFRHRDLEAWVEAQAVPAKGHRDEGQ